MQSSAGKPQVLALMASKNSHKGVTDASPPTHSIHCQRPGVRDHRTAMPRRVRVVLAARAGAVQYYTGGFNVLADVTTHKHVFPHLLLQGCLFSQVQVIEK